MPRPSKGPRLYLRRSRPTVGRKAVWLIRDGQRDFATGCLGSSADKGPPEAAQQALARYIADKYRPTRKARDIEKIDIADVLSMSPKLTVWAVKVGEESGLLMRMT